MVPIWGLDMQDTKLPAERIQYAKPTVEKLASLAELTQQLKQFGAADGFLLVTSEGDLSLTNVS